MQTVLLQVYLWAWFTWNSTTAIHPSSALSNTAQHACKSDVVKVKTCNTQYKTHCFPHLSFKSCWTWQPTYSLLRGTRMRACEGWDNNGLSAWCGLIEEVRRENCLFLQEGRSLLCLLWDLWGLDHPALLTEFIKHGFIFEYLNSIRIHSDLTHIDQIETIRPNQSAYSQYEHIQQAAGVLYLWALPPC